MNSSALPNVFRKYSQIAIYNPAYCCFLTGFTINKQSLIKLLVIEMPIFIGYRS